MKISAFYVLMFALTAAARAPAGEQRKYRTAYACEGSTLSLSCGESGEVISLVRANYGRFSITICNEHGDTDWSVNCMSHRSLRVLHAKCNQQSNCSILASTSVFGDPCPGTLKYLEAHYQCVPATPASPTPRPRPPWMFTSAGPTMWSTLALNVTAPTPTKPVTQPSTVAATEASTNATAAQESSTAEAPTESTSAATTAATTSSTSTTPPTTTPLPSLLSEQSEVTVLVPDFPGRRPHTSTAPSPTSPSTTTEKALVAEQEEEEELEVDEDHEPTTTPSPSTTATAGKKDGRPANGEQGAVYCQPTVSRGNYWNWTRAGQEASQPCPGGATGYARWYCAGTSASSAHWYPSSPDLSGCKSVWLTSLDSRIGEGDSIISIANDLASVTHSKTLYGGDMMAAAGLLKQMAVKMGKDLEAFPDWRQREAIVTELVQSVIRAGSSLLGSAQSLAWRDLGLAVSAGRSALAADGSPDGEAHYHARTTATALLTGLEENAFLLANTINRQKNYFQSYDNILLSVRVLDMRAINELSFPSSEELQVWKSKEDWIVLPVEALQENSENGLVRVVLFAYEHMEDILSPASLGGHYYPGGGSVSSPKEDGRQAANASRIVNSRVISASLGKGRHIQLPQPVTIRFQHLRQDNVSNPTCVFWDYTVSAWSDEGCRVLATNRTHTQCRCDHLTNFAVLMDLHSAPLASHHQQALAAVTYAGCGLSILCLALSLVVFALCGSQFKSDRATIHKNLCLCLLVAEVIFLAGVNATHDRIGCSVVAGLLHYAFLAAFTWMLLEGHQLYVMLVEVFESDKSRLKCYYLVGYGLPLLVVSVSAMVDPFSYGTANYCWLRADNYFIFSFVGPVIVILLANFVFLGMAIWVMNRHQTTSAVMKSKEQSRLTNARSWIRGAFALAVLLGLTWTLGLLYLNESSVIMAYAFTAVNSLQGCFVFFIVCLRSEQVRKEMRKWLRRHGWAECLSDASPSPSGPGALGKDNQTSFYGSSGSAGATLSANDTLPAAQYIAQPWRGGDVNLASPQVSNNNSSMRLNNTKNSQLRSSSRTLKQQPIIGSPHELENGSYKSYGRDSGNGSSEQDESSPRQQQIRLQQQQQQQQLVQQQLVQQQLVQQQQQQQQQSANGSMNRARGNNYPHPVPNPALAEGAAMDAQLIAQFRGNNSSPLRLGHHQQHLRGSNKRCRSASPWNHTYMEIDMRRGARKTLAEQDEDGMVGDPVYEEIERNACGDACPCSGHLQRAPMVHYQQASDASDEERRQNSSDVSRQSSRSYGDNRPLIPMHHHHHHHQLSNQSAPGGTHDLLTTISCAFNSPHLRTKHRHQFEPAPTHQPIHMGFDAAPHFDAERYAQRPPPMYPYQDQETGLTALSVVNGERIFVASGALLEQSPRNQPIQRPPVPFTEC